LLQKFFRRNTFRVRGVTRSISESARDIFWLQGIAPKDAIHVATAVDAKASALETFDGGLLKKTGLVGNPPLLIRQPIAPRQRKLI
jgi:predicted nucleic acid-binding protein